MPTKQELMKSLMLRFICIILLFSVTSIFLSCNEKKVKVPYYRIDQSYTSTIEKGELYFDLTTSVCKVNRYSINDYAADRDNMYGMKITGISEDKIEKYLLNEYGKAEKLISTFEHVDQMIDKDYKGKEEEKK